MQNDFVEAMDDDFNTAGALGAIFSFVSEANTLLSEVVLTTADAASLDSARQKVVELMGVLGIALTSEEQQEEGSEELLSFAMEAAGYTGIGINKLRALSNDEHCTWVLWNGTRRMIKRSKLESYLDTAYSI
mgnify:CR=1 FL=1